MPGSTTVTTAAALGLLACAGACSDASVDAAAGGGGAAGAGGGPAVVGSASSSGEGASGGGAPASVTTGSTASGPGSGAGGTGAGGGEGGTDGAPEIERACADQVRDCGNALDDDDDGLVDADDPDCFGACDITESSFHSGFPGSDPAPCAVDCLFDADESSVEDDCHWSTRCDPHAVAPTFDPRGDPACAHEPDAPLPGGLSCAAVLEAQSPQCEAYCGPLVPNGCDCFGCCELPAGGGRFAWLQSQGEDETGTPIPCSTATMDDPTLCRACEPVPSCFNACDACETCLGAPPPGEACTEAQQCPGGEPACGRPGQERCPAETYCVTGCCQQVPE